MPRNMIVRLGVDASDFKRKMKQAGVDAENAGKKIKKSMTMSELGSEVRSIMGWGSSSSGIMGTINVGNFDAAKSQLSILKSYRDQLADAGFDDYQFGLVSERIKVLEYELNAYEETLQRTADAEREAAGAAGNLGNQAHQTSIPVSKASRELREMSSSGRRLSIVPGFLRRVGDSAGSSNSRLEKMVRSIRNVSVVSFGLRLVRGLFGELGTIIRQQVSQDAALQAQVDSLKASLGQSLAPAINLVANAFSVAMPYVVGFSNAIGSLITNLFGSGWTTVSSGANTAAKAIGGAGKAQNEFNRSLQGFDEITRLESQKSGGGGGGSSSTSAATPVEGRLPTWMTGIVDQLNEAISGGDWAKVGNTLAKGFSDMVKKIDWAKAFSSVGSFLGGVGAVIWGAVGDSLTKHWDWLGRKTEEFGGNIWMGIGAGIGSALRNVGSWLKENFFNPMIKGFKDTFKIHSPSQHPEIQGIGKNIMLGILNGILEPWKDPVGWIKEHIFTPLVEGLKKLFGADTAIGKTVSNWLFGNEDWNFQMTAEITDTDTSRVDGDPVKAKALFTKAQDAMSTEAKIFNAKARITAAINSLKTSDTTIPTVSNYVRAVNSMSSSATTVGVAARYDRAVNNLSSTATTVGTSARFDTAQDNLTTAQKIFDASARFKSIINSLGASDTVFDAKALFKTAQDNLNTDYKSFAANARFTKAVNELSAADTTISTKAAIQKGWSGSLEDALGIKNLYSTLHVETPEVKVKWNTSYSDPNNKNSTSVKVPTYELQYPTTKNAIGAIFTGASLLGRVGGRDQIAGEAGREALLPLDRHTWWMDDIADRVEARIGGSPASADRPIQVNLVVDGKVLANTVVRNVNAQARATGKNPLAAYI